MKRLLNYWNKIKNIGKDSSLSLYNIKVLNNINAASFIFILVSFSYAVLNFFQGRPLLTTINLSITLNLTTVLILNHYRKYDLAKIVLLFFNAFSLTLSGFIYKNQSELYLLSVLIAITLIYRNRSIQIISSVILSAIFIAIKFVPYPFEVDLPVQPERTILNVCGGLFCLIYIIMIQYNAQISTNRIIRKQHLLVQKNNQNMKKILTIIAHDVRAPLGSIQNLLFLYKEKIISREIATDTFESINDRLTNLDSTLVELLNWSSTSLRRSRVEPKDIKLIEAIDHLCVFLKSQFENKNLQILTDIPSDLSVFADPDHLNIIVRNLLNNAIKFSHNEGKIVLSASQENDQIRLKIQDYGIGISAEKMKNFFETIQTPNLGTAGERGTGFGLVLVNDLIQQNNGHITLKSKLGEGSTFIISLPKSKALQQTNVLVTL